MPFPVQVVSFATTCAGRRYEVLLCKYQQSSLLTITEVGTLGTVIAVTASRDFAAESSGHTVRTVLGRQEPLFEACARQLVTRLERHCTGTVLVSLGIRHSGDVQDLRELVETVSTGVKKQLQIDGSV